MGLENCRPPFLIIKKMFARKEFRKYLRKYVKIFPQIRAHISRNLHAYFRKYVYVFAEIYSAGREMMFWNVFCGFIMGFKFFFIYDIIQIWVEINL